MKAMRAQALLLLAAAASIASVCSAQNNSAVCPDIPVAGKYFSLVASEQDISLPGDKTLKGGLVYNGSYIGPLITAQLGDTITVDIKNDLKVATSTHWHGQKLQNATWADGVGGVSQNSAAPGSTFRYQFTADGAGTYWYHAHTGMQFGDGLRGPLVITDPNDPYKGEYDEEVILLLTDQSDVPGQEELDTLQRGEGMDMAAAADDPFTCRNVSAQDWSDQAYYTILTNGKGWVSDEKTGKPAGEPYVLRVKQGKRYRIRIIQGAASWGIKLTFPAQAGSADLIAIDGENVERKPVSGLVLTPGERADVIFTANQTVGNYWMNVATITGRNSPLVISYDGATADYAADKALGEPDLNLGCDWALPAAGVIDFKNDTAAVTPLPATYPKPPAAATKSFAVYLTLNSNPIEAVPANVLSMRADGGSGEEGGVQGKIAKAAATSHWTSALNISSNVKPMVGCPLLEDGSQALYCWTLNWVPFSPASNALVYPDAKGDSQTYVEDVALGDVVDIAFINPGMMVHPMHLHGQSFYVLGSGNGDILTADGAIDYSKLNTANPLYRDTQPVPNAYPAPGATCHSANGTCHEAGAGGSGMAADGGNGGMAAGGNGGMAAEGGDKMAGMEKQPVAAAATSGGEAMKGMGAAANAPAPNGSAMEAMGGDVGAGQVVEGANGAEVSFEGMKPVAGATPENADGMMAANGMAMTTTDNVNGYTVLRFRANNPGVWALHCHIELHANSGMFMAFRVADPKVKQPWELPGNLQQCNGGGMKM